MIKKFCRDGFTLVELSIALLFIGILSIVIILIINNTVEAYRRGLTLAQLNSTGMNLVDDIRMAVQNSTARSLSNSCEIETDDGNTMPQEERNECQEDGAYNFVTVVKTENINLENSGEVLKDVPIYGAFCTGTYSYIWNSGYFEMEDARFNSKTNRNWAKLIYKNDEGQEVRTFWDSSKPFRLLKVEDEMRAVCMAAVNPSGEQYKISLSGILNEIDITGFKMLQEEPVDLFNGTSGTLALYDFSAARPAESGEMNNIFYSVSFILGTVTGGINVQVKGNSCAPPNGYEPENFDYCAINKFNFAAQVKGG